MIHNIKLKKIIIKILRESRIERIIPDALFLKLSFFILMKKRLNIKHPSTFNEKLQWLKLHDKNPLYTKMVDKYEAKIYVSDIIGPQYIIPTIGLWDKFSDIDFEKLPDKFVLKCTHDSGTLIICKDKKLFDINFAKKKIEKSLKHNYFYNGREWPYKNVKPRIIVEKYIEDSSKQLQDYKFFCFDGVPKVLKVDFDRFSNHKANYFDCENNKIMPFGEISCPPDFSKNLILPRNIEIMKRLAAELSRGIKFLRVDFYDVDGFIYFGELTFYPASGFGRFTDDKMDIMLGNLIT